MSAIAIVPAAGRAERFGGGKLIANVEGEPLLNRTLRSLLDGGVARLIVVVAPDTTLETAVALLSDPRVTRVINPDPSRGMFSSIQVGVAAAEGDPILVLPGDMPFVKSATVAAIIAAATESGRIVAPRYQGKRGHPVALPGRLREDILRTPFSSTLATVLAAHLEDRSEIDVDDRGIVRDVDARGDLTGG